jgi:hypothetical protein
MDAPVKSMQYLPLHADFQHKYRCNIILPPVCCVEGSLKNGLVPTYIEMVLPFQASDEVRSGYRGPHRL